VNDTLAATLAAAIDRRAAATALILPGRAPVGYGELAALAARVEQHLPVARNGLVAIWCDGSPLSFAILLSCLIHARPWFALSDMIPDARIATMLSALPVETLMMAEHVPVKRPALLDMVPAGTTPVVLDASGRGGARRHRPVDRIGPLPALPDDTLCVFATSGSTGQPKYVPLSGRNIGSFLSSLHRFHPTDGDHRFSLLHELSSSASLQNLLLAFGSGAALAVSKNLSFLKTGQFLRDARVDILHIVPSLLRLLEKTGQLRPGSLPDVGLAMIGGEQVRRPAVEALRAAAVGAKLFNSYGPTEATVNIAIDACPEGDAWSEDIAPIGRAFEGHAFALIDGEGRPSAQGELAISGPQIAAGYVGNDAETAAKFVRLPAVDVGIATWYRTGDAVRTDVRGRYVVTGRIDRELKINGYRVDPSEIENAIRSVLPFSGNVVAIALESPERQIERVVAVVEGEAIDSALILRHCGAVLAPYMVPHEVLNLPALPLNVNGKLDIAALGLFCRARWEASRS
jgi:non-ribosomal peptide synthetase component F